MKSEIIVLFDFDGTLIKKDSFIEFGCYCMGRYRFGLAIMKSFPKLLLWKLGFIPAGKAKEYLFGKMFKDMDYSFFIDKCRSFISHLDLITNKDVIEKFQTHILSGHTVYIVSASINQWIIPWAAAYGLSEDRILATEIEINKYGKLTGQFSTPNCNGKEKVKRILSVETDINNKTVYAYGNSTSDEPMLELADYPALIP